MRFDVRVIKTLIQIVESEIDICSEFFKPFVHVGGEVVEALIDRIEAFGHSFEANIHGVLEPVDLRLDVHEPSACFGYETSEFGVGNKLMVIVVQM
jgi:hypothetical protein